MDDGTFLFFLFGITAVAFLSIILISYLIFYFLFQDEDGDKPENYLPLNLRIDLNKYTKLSNYESYDGYSDAAIVRELLSVAYCQTKGKPSLVPIELSSTQVTTESLLIRDRGITAFHFIDYYDQIGFIVSNLGNEEVENANETTALLSSSNVDISDIKQEFKNNNIMKLLKYYDYQNYIPKSIPFVVEDLVEIDFKPGIMSEMAHSTVLNLPIPTVNRKNDVIYFETKLLEYNFSWAELCIGLVTNPDYPNFQLPGYLPYSFSINSSGNLEMTTKDYQEGCDAKTVLPYLTAGDVIGLGYRSISGTIFLTHNGKLICEVVKYFKFEMYPCIGVKNLSPKSSSEHCKMSVNLGQMGFVYIEANVKKLGFCENRNDGLIGAPPIYNKTNQTNEILLDKGDDIPPDYPVDENNFFGPIVGSSSMIASSESEKQTGNQIDANLQPESRDSSERSETPSSEPPSYNSEKKSGTTDMNDQEYENLVSANSTAFDDKPLPNIPETQEDNREVEQHPFDTTNETSALLSGESSASPEPMEGRVPVTASSTTTTNTNTTNNNKSTHSKKAGKKSKGKRGKKGKKKSKTLF